MGGDVVLAVRYVIEGSLGEAAFFDEFVADFVDVFTVVHVRQFIDMADSLFAYGLDHHVPVIQGFPGNVLYQAAHKKQVVLPWFFH
jgi:hypothetical protein